MIDILEFFGFRVVVGYEEWIIFIYIILCLLFSFKDIRLIYIFLFLRKRES